MILNFEIHQKMRNFALRNVILNLDNRRSELNY